MDLYVSLTDDLAKFVMYKVAAGRYRSSSEVVREALRLMQTSEQQDAGKLSLLRQAWRDGIGGEAGEIDFLALKQEARGRLAAS